MDEYQYTVKKTIHRPALGPGLVAHCREYGAIWNAARASMFYLMSDVWEPQDASWLQITLYHSAHLRKRREEREMDGAGSEMSETEN